MDKLVYIEYLTCGRLLKILKEQGFFERRHKRFLYVFDTTSIAFWVGNLLGRLFDFYIERLDFQISEIRDQEGLSIFNRILYRDLAKVHKSILEEPFYIESIKQISPNGLGRLFVMKSIAYPYDFLAHYKYYHLWQALVLIRVVSWHKDKSSFQTPLVILYINHRPWFKNISEYGKESGITLHSLNVLKLLRFQLNLLKQRFAKLNGSLIKAFLTKHLFPLIKHKLKFTNKESKKYPPCLWVEYQGNLNLKEPQCNSDLFFIHEGGIRPQDVLISFNNIQDPLDTKKYKKIQEWGLRSVTLADKASFLDEESVPVYRPQINILPSSIQHKDFESFTLNNSWHIYQQQYAYWREFFRQNNVRLSLSWYKYEVDHMAIADALKNVNGIATIYQRSYEPGASPQVITGTDIIFGFSPKGFALEKENKSQFSYHISVGYVGDYRFDFLRSYVSQIRERLKEAGARNIIAFLDETSLDDGRWFVGNQMAQQNYRFWLEKLLANQSLGLILKPKRIINLRHRLGPITELLDKALKTGRCFIFEGGSLQSSFPPAAAALAADIAIHECLVSGTAGLEAALAGIPTLLVDLEGWKPSPLYKLGPDVVFTDWPSVWDACQAFFKDPKANKHLGDWSSMIHELDPFHDGKAALRMSQYLKWLLEGLRSGENRESVMAMVAERYAKQWGKDKVQSFQ